ncbi:hypothetical protein [Methylibium sp.]|uniref:hypothetical protein n=1 Tax=Methylibium sp. TaxID=2067992 RepID=UPI00334035E6
MKPKQRWVFVDDQSSEAQSFADSLSEGTSLDVKVLSPYDAEKLLLTGKEVPAGVLLDVDLSNADGVYGTGPGIAQDLRVKQRAGQVGEYPIVRFAGRGPIQKNIEGDPASDDLFDLKIPKESIATGGTSHIVKRLEGVSLIYQEIERVETPTPEAFLSLVDLTQEQWDLVGHPAFADRLLGAMQVATHVAAGTFVRSFLLPPGLLIDEKLLAVRLGVDAPASGANWTALRDSLGFSYNGIGNEAFVRWWAKGLDDWWFTIIGAEDPLSTLDSAARVGLLCERTKFKELTPLQLPHGSAGTKPWRHCSLSAEESPPRVVPIDPVESVRFANQVDLPPWRDPAYASLGAAAQWKADFRVNRADLDRLLRKHKAT